MTAPIINDSMYQGDTDTVTLYIKDNAGNTVNITGATIAYVIQTSPGVTAGEVSKTATITNGTAGTATISFVATDTASLTPQVYYHQGTMTDSSGRSKVIFTGNLTLNKKG